MAEIKEVRLNVYLGATIQVEGMNWAKPSVSADVKFDGMPTPDQLEKAWHFLWEDQVGPQIETFVEWMKDQIHKRQMEMMGATNAPGVQPIADGGRYE